MPSLPARILLFLSSYAPLSLIFVLLFWNKSPQVAAVSGAIAVVGVAGMLLYLLVVSHLDGVSTKAASCHSRGDQVMSYIVTYIIPFLAVAFSDWQQAVALAVFFFILGFLYVNSDMIHINPTLNILGYRLYEITLDSGSTYSLIAHHSVHKGDTIQAVRVGDDILFAKGSNSHAGQR